MGFVINKDKTDSRLAEVSRDYLAHIAMLYYKEGMMQTEIASHMNVSRASVVNYLKIARDHGIVDIRIEGEAFASSNLSRDLRECFNLTHVYLTESSATESTDMLSELATERLARIGSMAVYDLLTEGMKVGVGWGTTMIHLAREIPRGFMPETEIFQLMGGTKKEIPYGAEDCAMRIATRLNASFEALHAPAIVSNAALREGLEAEPGVRQALDALRSLDLVVFSVDSSAVAKHTVDAGIRTKEDVEYYNSIGAVGTFAGRFYDEAGKTLTSPRDDCIISMHLEDLVNVPTRVLVSGGLSKLAGIAGALKGGHVTHLVIDRPTGEKLLEL